MRRIWLPVVLVALMAGCGPKYPNCKGDKDCKEKEFCVNGKCQQCRPGENDCARGEECVQGACKPIAGYCETHAQCPPNQSCINNRCKPCVADTDCGEGKCHNGRCQAKDFCVTDADCPQDADCVKGHCIVHQKATSGLGEGCALESVYFDFNESVLTTNATETLQKDAACLKATKRGVRLEGHADPRGTEEYNLALSDRRAQSVKRYLENLGVSGRRLRPVPKGKTEAKGTDERSWAKDRRVDAVWE
jgi:peptidoglycan-associated lipoprotein